MLLPVCVFEFRLFQRSRNSDNSWQVARRRDVVRRLLLRGTSRIFEGKRKNIYLLRKRPLTIYFIYTIPFAGTFVEIITIINHYCRTLGPLLILRARVFIKFDDIFFFFFYNSEYIMYDGETNCELQLRSVIRSYIYKVSQLYIYFFNLSSVSC